ncbi:MAG: serine hydrolase [Alphaproteobacteria bacterium]|nr:serine hydrolase [Alphaproteobacteria bacterium]
MVVRLAGLCCALWLLSAPAGAAAPGWPERLDPVVRRAMADWQAPGLALAVLRGGEVAALRAWGVRDVETGAPVTPRTVFALGSITKTLTAVGIALLADEGKLAWDAPAIRALPSLRFATGAMTRTVSLRDLMSHRTGMARHDALWYFGVHDAAGLLARLRFLPPSAPAGTVYQYNNLMVAVAGYAAAHAAGTGWADFTRARLLRPLGMTETALSAAAFRAAPERATGYYPADAGREPIPLRDTDAVAPAAAAYAPVTDAAKLLRFLLREGAAADGTTLVSAAALAELRRRAMARPDTSRVAPFRVTGYGAGLYIGIFRNAPIHWHWGAIDGYAGMLSFRPETRDGVVVLTNLSGRNPVPTLVTLAAYDALDGRDPAIWPGLYGARPSAAERAPPICPATDGAAHPRDDYLGTYEHPAYGRAEILAEPDDLLVLHLHGRAVRLDGCGGDAWMVRDGAWPIREGLVVRFARDADGRVKALAAAIADGPTYRLNPGPLVFRRAERPDGRRSN